MPIDRNLMLKRHTGRKQANADIEVYLFYEFWVSEQSDLFPIFFSILHLLHITFLHKIYIETAY